MKRDTALMMLIFVCLATAILVGTFWKPGH